MQKFSKTKITRLVLGLCCHEAQSAPHFIIILPLFFPFNISSRLRLCKSSYILLQHLLSIFLLPSSTLNLKLVSCNHPLSLVRPYSEWRLLRSCVIVLVEASFKIHISSSRTSRSEIMNASRYLKRYCNYRWPKEK